MNRIEILKKTKLFVLDMDGTFYLGEHVLDGALDFISSVKKAGKDFIFKAYAEAIKNKYRFFSYGDCMFIK